MVDSTSFLLKVWKLQCEIGDYVCLSSKGSIWKDTLLPYDDRLGEGISEWIDKNQGKDLYFCPLPFNEKKRSKVAVSRSRMLWSDIDGADPYKVEPSVLWESSPGRYQGLWILPKSVYPKEAEELSKKMAYYIGADRGGWDLTQVLRIPGTLNLKYPDKPEVKLIHFKSTILKDIPQSPLDRWRSTIPRKLLRIIEGPAEQGKRSDILWYLEHELCDLGIPIKDVFSILRESDWNKYRGRSDEDERFSSEMEKIRENRKEKKSVTRVDSVVLEVIDYEDLMSSSSSTPGWLVRDFWMRNSHGIIAGEPKSFKSTLAMDMLFSVAADCEFLGRYPVEYGGPVLIVQNENADWIMKDRLEKLAFSRGEVGNVKTGFGKRLRIEWARNLPLYFVNQQGFTLDDAANKEALEDLIRRIRPVAINLDPLYLMFSGDVNSAKDLNPVLNWCLYIKQTYNCSVILVHHYNKGGEGKRGGQRMLGSTTLHGWIESAWYIQSHDEGVLSLDREFRGAGLYPKVELQIDMGSFGDPKYNVNLDIKPISVEKGEQDILDVIAQSSDMLSKSMVAKRTGLSRYKVDTLIEALVRDGQLRRSGERYGLAKQYGGE